MLNQSLHRDYIRDYLDKTDKFDLLDKQLNQWGEEAFDMGHNLKNVDSDSALSELEQELKSGRKLEKIEVVKDDDPEIEKIKEKYKVPKEHKNRLYKRPDIAFLVPRGEVQNIILNDLKSLFERGGVYFALLDREPIITNTVVKRSFPEIDKTQFLVLFFEDAILDVQAEKLRIKCTMN